MLLSDEQQGWVAGPETTSSRCSQVAVFVEKKRIMVTLCGVAHAFSNENESRIIYF